MTRDQSGELDFGDQSSLDSAIVGNCSRAAGVGDSEDHAAGSGNDRARREGRSISPWATSTRVISRFQENSPRRSRRQSAAARRIIRRLKGCCRSGRRFRTTSSALPECDTRRGDRRLQRRPPCVLRRVSRTHQSRRQSSLLRSVVAERRVFVAHRWRVDRDSGDQRERISADARTTRPAPERRRDALPLLAGKSHRHGDDEEQLTAILQAVVAENRKREKAGKRPLFVLHDQMYGALVSHGTDAHLSCGGRPEVGAIRDLRGRRVEGLRGHWSALGWMLAAPAMAARIRDLLSHAGAWAPRAEQLAMAKFLNDPDAIAEFRK